MSWGYKILVVILLFIGGMGFMVSVAMKQKNEMIDEQYYVKELKHQGQIDAENNLNALAQKLIVKDSLSFIKMIVPDIASKNITEATIVFLRPSDMTKDRKFPMNLDTYGQQIFDRSLFIKGQYKLRISWKSNGKAYYYEQPYFKN